MGLHRRARFEGHIVAGSRSSDASTQEFARAELVDRHNTDGRQGCIEDARVVSEVEFPEACEGNESSAAKPCPISSQLPK